MKIKNIFRKKNKYASPYYGSNGALFNSSAVPLRLEQQPEQEVKQKIKASQLPPPPDPRPTEPDWEQRRFELMKMLVAQDRRSVVLGKLRATDKQIAAKARCLADAAIYELQTHPFKGYDEEGEKSDV
jgi:hypothetical protein